MRSAVFLDRDGTIIDDVGFISSIDDVVFFPYAVDALKLLQKKHLFFIATNQSCVGLGKVSAKDAATVNDFVLAHLAKNGVRIEALYCCAHKRDDNCDCIKPKSLFPKKAQLQFNLDLSKSYTVGDHPHDVDFGTGVGATGIYLLTGHGQKHHAQMPANAQCFDNLMTAAQWIDTRSTL